MSGGEVVIWCVAIVCGTVSLLMLFGIIAMLYGKSRDDKLNRLAEEVASIKEAIDKAQGLWVKTDKI